MDHLNKGIYCAAEVSKKGRRIYLIRVTINSDWLFQRIEYRRLSANIPLRGRPPQRRYRFHEPHSLHRRIAHADRRALMLVSRFRGRASAVCIYSIMLNYINFYDEVRWWLILTKFHLSNYESYGTIVGIEDPMESLAEINSYWPSSLWIINVHKGHKSAYLNFHLIENNAFLAADY